MQHRLQVDNNHITACALETEHSRGNIDETEEMVGVNSENNKIDVVQSKFIAPVRIFHLHVDRKIVAFFLLMHRYDYYYYCHLRILYLHRDI